MGWSVRAEPFVVRSPVFVIVELASNLLCATVAYGAGLFQSGAAAMFLAV